MKMLTIMLVVCFAATLAAQDNATPPAVTLVEVREAIKAADAAWDAIDPAAAAVTAAERALLAANEAYLAKLNSDVAETEVVEAYAAFKAAAATAEVALAAHAVARKNHETLAGERWRIQRQYEKQTKAAKRPIEGS